MIEGMVTAAHKAVVPLSLQVPEGRTEDIKAVLDTGYSGFLTLPVALVVDLRVSVAYVGRAFLANDGEVEFDVHDVTVLWDGQPRHVRADATGSTPLVGMALLNGHNLYVDVAVGGRVVIRVME